ncbi:hypothetical protein KP509_28G065400 [Ceratopteris richardii]|uniref:Uncharacterized protein n=1 Tax=Ceratopteris richardii TaxID=49495 RepID=A0A8T2RES6_CERRI|nr:hypothetical protein KP509_28G065400 [Ceratopteris richardii]
MQLIGNITEVAYAIHITLISKLSLSLSLSLSLRSIRFSLSLSETHRHTHTHSIDSIEKYCIAPSSSGEGELVEFHSKTFRFMDNADQERKQIPNRSSSCALETIAEESEISDRTSMKSSCLKIIATKLRTRGTRKGDRNKRLYMKKEKVLLLRAFVRTTTRAYVGMMVAFARAGNLYIIVKYSLFSVVDMPLYSGSQTYLLFAPRGSTDL